MRQQQKIQGNNWLYVEEDKAPFYDNKMGFAPG